MTSTPIQILMLHTPKYVEEKYFTIMRQHPLQGSWGEEPSPCEIIIQN